MLSALVYPLYVCFAVARTYTRFALVRKPRETSSSTRAHGHLEFLNLISLLGLATAFFMQLNLAGDWLQAALIVAALVAYDLIVRWMFLRLAVRRLCRSSSRISRQSALHQVHRTAGYAEISQWRSRLVKPAARRKQPRREAIHV